MQCPGPDRRLAVIAEQLDQLGDDFAFVFLASPRLAHTLSGQHFASRDPTHFGCITR
jgi:hypothetical protein